MYSLGVLLYELLAGHTPIKVDSVPIAEAMRRVREVDPPALGEVDRELRGDIETIARAAMEKRREDRYSAAASLAADIRRFLRSEPITARPPTAMYYLRVFARRNKTLVASAAVIVVVLVTGIMANVHGVALVVRGSASRAEDRGFLQRHDYLRDSLSRRKPVAGLGLVGGSARAAGAADRPLESFAVPDLLEVAATQLERTFADEPVIEAELYDTLGRTLTYMGRGDGIKYLERALEIREADLGPNHPDTIRSRIACAVRD